MMVRFHQGADTKLFSSWFIINTYRYMKKIFIILWFMIIWLLGFESRVDADCVKDILACIEMWPSNPNYSDCMQNANNAYNSCLEKEQSDANKAANKKFCEENGWEFIDDGTEDGQCLVESNEVKCENKCEDYAWSIDDENSAKSICMCRCRWNIVLNTDMPFVWRCLEKASGTAGISGVSQAITRILMTLILIWWFGNLVFAWVQFASNNAAGGKKRVINTIIAFAVIWSIWIILRLINPNIFK